MSDGFSNKPKILRGAFVEYGLSLPPLFVVFQFNPVELSRNRSLSYSVPGQEQRDTPSTQTQGRQSEVRTSTHSLREFHRREEYSDLLQLQKDHQVRIQEEGLSFEIRLDATDKLSDGDVIAQTFGIAPQLSTLELMVHPKEESLIGAAIGSLLGSPGGFSFTKGENPPLILFIWGLKRVLPVTINSLNITETEFNTMLDPIRATVSVNLTVIEGKNLPYQYSKVAKEVSSVLNLANIGDIANVVIPG